VSNDPAKGVKRLRDVFRSSFCGTGGEVHQAGREVLANLKAMTGYGSSPFRPDPVSMAYAVGQQDVVRHILMMLNIPDEEIYRLTNTVNNSEGSFADD
jgi:hypothetical protein